VGIFKLLVTCWNAQPPYDKVLTTGSQRARTYVNQWERWVRITAAALL